MKLLRKLIVLALLGLLALIFYPTLKKSIERLFYPLEYRSIIKEASGRYGLDPYLVTAVIFEESKFDPAVRSKVGAVGLMQIMPETGEWIAGQQDRFFQEEDLLDPATNADMGCWYLRYLKNRLANEDLALAAYNGGPDNVGKWMSQWKPPDMTVRNIPFKETRDFVARVNATRTKYRELYEGAFE